MDWHRPEKARFTVREEAGDLVVSCRYWQVRHSLEAGGNISSIVFPHGSGRNIFAAPCMTEIGAMVKGAFRTYQTRRAGNSASRLSCYATGETVCVESESPLIGADGERLPAVCRHRYEYHPWGYIRQRVSLDITETIPGVWQVTVARPLVATHLNEFGFRPAETEPQDWRMHCMLRKWEKFSAGESIHDYRSVWLANLPIYFTFLQRGIEGFDWFMGDDLGQWHRQIANAPNMNEFIVIYRGNPEGYEVRLCPLGCHPQQVDLKGSYRFDSFLGLPFVQERVRPPVRCIGGLLEARRDKRGTKFPSAAKVAEYGRHAVQLTRLHNDGPSRDGIFWRDGAYPPYPPQRMKAMDRCIRQLHRRGVRAVPYFSLHEFHPDVPPFAQKAKEWQRVADDSGRMLHNCTPLGEYGAQMCLASDWLKFRKKTIDIVLRSHDFDGIYYDWCLALPCLHKGHGSRAHWDVEEFIELLEWTRERVGPDGVLYLHMSAVPFAIAQNLANDILTYEEFTPLKVNPDMFPPASQYMKTCMHGVLPMGEGAKQPRLFALCALLNHLAPDSGHPEILRVFKAISRVDFTGYKNFENHRTEAVRTTRPEIRAAVYWNEQEALVMLANLSEEPRRFNWKLLPGNLGWGRDRYAVQGKSPHKLGPLSFRYVRARRIGRGRGMPIYCPA